MPISSLDEQQLKGIGIYFDDDGAAFHYNEDGEIEPCIIPLATLKKISNVIAPEKEVQLSCEEKEHIHKNFDIFYEGDKSYYYHQGQKKSTGLTDAQLRHYCYLDEYSKFMSNTWSSVDSLLNTHCEEIIKILTITREKWHLPTTQVDHKGRVIYQSDGEVELDILDKWHVWADVTNKLVDSMDELLARYSDLDLNNDQIRESMFSIGYVLRTKGQDAKPKRRVTVPRLVYLTIKNNFLRRMFSFFKK